MSGKAVYLDYAATTPVDPRVVAKMLAYLGPDQLFANPASKHPSGQRVKQDIELAREQVASLIGAEASEIIFTSGATESNNLALKGAAHLYKRNGKHIITSKTEHKSVLEVCQQLEKEGFIVTYLKPNPNGLIELSDLKAAMQNDTILVSIMQVNNELGVIQDIANIAAVVKSTNALLHVDAAQSAGKMNIDVRHIPIDLLSLSGHKLYAPKGVGALYIRKKPRVRVEAQIHGGGQEQGMRAGTLASHQIIAMGQAFHLAQQEMEEEIKRITQLRDYFVKQLNKVTSVHFNTDLSLSVPHILNVRFEGISAKDLMEVIAVSAASACQNSADGVSYVLRALGQTEQEAKNAIRFSFGRWTTEAELDIVLSRIQALQAQ